MNKILDCLETAGRLALQALSIGLFIALVAVAIVAWWLTGQLWGFGGIAAVALIIAVLSSVGIALMLWQWRIQLHDYRTA